MANSKSVIRTQRRKKKQAVEYLGGKCSICGYDKCQQALDCHHVDPETKEHSCSYIIMRWTWDRVKPELDKCILVCRNCHAEIHYGMYAVESLRRRVLPLLNKTCVMCETAFTTKSSSQKCCSDPCSRESQRKFNVSKADLKRLIEQHPYETIGNMFGVSGNAIKKRCKLFGLTLQSRRGYWTGK